MWCAHKIFQRTSVWAFANVTDNMGGCEFTVDARDVRYMFTIPPIKFDLNLAVDLEVGNPVRQFALQWSECELRAVFSPGSPWACSDSSWAIVLAVHEFASHCGGMNAQ